MRKNIKSIFFKCPRCHRKYSLIKVRDFDWHTIIGFLAEKEGRFYFYCFNEDIYNEESELLLSDYYEYSKIRCDFCCAMPDYRTKDGNFTRMAILEAFKNKKNYRTF